VTAALREVVHSIEPRAPLVYEGSVERAIAFSFLPARAAAAALGAFGLLAVGIALIGIYGLASYAVTTRTREMGIRMAIGAQRHQVLATLLGRVALVLSVGALAGVAVSLALGPLLAAVVHTAATTDPLVMLGTVGTLVLVGILASWVPARRALALNPAVTLREG
jgi:ABC-type antimicrobial peptide transport system permease subunit